MHSNTGEIVEIPDGEMEEIEKAFEAQVEKVRKVVRDGGETVRKVLEKVDPVLVPISSEELERIRKMNKERRKAWAKSQIERRVRRKRERRARKEGRRGRSR